MRIGCLLLMILSSVVAAPAQAATVRFDELPGLVAAQNGTVAAGRAYVEEADARTGHWRRSLLPIVRASGGGEVFQTGTSARMTQPVGEIEGRLNLFRGGKDRLEDDALRAAHTVARANARQTTAHETARARMLYADARYYDELRGEIARLLDWTRTHAGLVRRQIEAGLATDTDRFDCELFRNHLRQEALLAQEDFEHAIAELKVVLGMPTESPVTLAPIGRVPDVLMADGWTPTAHPDVVRLAQQADIARVQQRQAERWWMPSLDVYGGYALHPFREREYAAARDRNEAVGGVQLSMDLFDGRAGTAKRRGFAQKARGLQLEAAQKSQELIVLGEKLHHELQSRRQLIRLLEEQRGLHRTISQRSADEYQRGVKSGVQLLDAARQRFDTGKRLADTRREAIHLFAALSALVEP